MIVIGGGPGGYIAAIRAAQLGKNVACIDEWKNDKGAPAPGGARPRKRQEGDGEGGRGEDHGKDDQKIRKRPDGRVARYRRALGERVGRDGGRGDRDGQPCR